MARSFKVIVAKEPTIQVTQAVSFTSDGNQSPSKMKANIAAFLLFTHPTASITGR
jgi:hypothetical protein